jgi:hypothetical protein
MFYTGRKNVGFQKDIVIRQHMSEGYPTGEFYIDGLRREDFQALADKLIALPADQYAEWELLSRTLERYLLTTDSVGNPLDNRW